MQLPYHFRIGALATELAVIHSTRPGAWEMFIDAFFGWPNATTEDVVVDGSAEWPGILDSLRNNESDASFVVYLPEPKHFEVADFFYACFVNEMYIVHRFDMATGIQDILESLAGKNRAVSLDSALLVVVWLTTMVALKAVNLDLLRGRRDPEARDDAVTKLRNRVDRNHRGVETSLFYHFGLLLYQNVPWEVQRVASRLVSVPYQYFVLIVVCALFANIKTKLMVVESNVLRSIADVVADRRGVLLFSDNDRLNKYLLESGNPAYVRLVERASGPNGLNIRSKGMQDVMVDLRFIRLMEDRGHVAVLESLIASMFTTLCSELIRNTTRVFIGQEEMTSLYALPIRKTMEPRVKRAVFRRYRILMEVGVFQYLYHHIIEGYIPTKWIIRNLDQVSVESESALPLQSLSTTFKLWAAGLAIAAACFTAERLRAR